MRVLIVEDGDEYLETLGRFVTGPTYFQAHSGAQALSFLAQHRVDVIYLDMRFDRSPQSELLGDVEAAIRRHNGQMDKAYRYLANNQGLFILEALRVAGHSETPVILAYDFSNELGRFARLSERHPNLSWMPDAVSTEEIRARLSRLGGETLT